MNRRFKKIIAWLLTPFSAGGFALSLLIGHFVLLIGLLFGGKAKKSIEDLFSFLIFSAFKLSGTRFYVKGKTKLKHLPKNRPIILVSNHQSMIDIPFITWVFRKHSPKFVAKIELARGYPYVSLNLRNGAGVLIDRKNARQAVKVLEEYGRAIAKHNHAICIFPEGTRAKDGILKNFKSSGLKSLLKVMPEAVIVPICIDRSWELVADKMLPVPFGTKVTLTILEPVEPNQEDAQELISTIHKEISRTL